VWSGVEVSFGFPRGLPAGATRLVKPRWPLLVLLGGVLVWFAPWLLAGEPRMGGDVTIEHYPRLTYAVAHLRSGALPFWSSLTLGGVPFLANPQLALLYPPHWLLLALLPVGTTLNVTAALHVGLAALATYALARRWALSPGAAMLAATCYGFNGLFAARLWAGQIGIVALAAWLPAVMLAADFLRVRASWRAVGLMTVALTLSLLVGAYQSWFLGVLVVGAFLATMPGRLMERGRRLAALALAGAISAGLAAPQLLPAAELVRWSLRAGRLDWQFATAASLPPWHLPTLLLPELFGSGAGTYWPGPWWHWHELTAYVGVLPLVLVWLGLRRPREPWVWYCAGLAAMALLLSLGRYTPLYGWLYDWLPGYGSFRDPGRHLVPASLAAALLAGRGADRLLAGRGYRPVTLTLLAVVLLGAIGAAVALRATEYVAPAVVPYLEGRGLWQPRPELATTSAAELGARVLLLAARACGMAVIAAAFGLVAAVLGRRGPQTRGALFLVAALFVDLSAFGWRYLHEPLPIAPGVTFASPEAQFTALLGPENLARLPSLGRGGRLAVLGQDGAIAANAGYLLGVPMAMGLDPLLPRRYAELVARIDEQPSAAFENLVLYITIRPSPLASLLNAPYRLVPRPPAANGRVTYDVEADPTTLPRAFIMSDVRPVADEGASLAALGELDPMRAVIVEAPDDAAHAQSAGAPTAAPPGDETWRPVELVLNAPGDVVLNADLPVAGAVVLLEAWHPGWGATLDGQDTTVYPADHAFMAVLAPPGLHEVRFRFHPTSFVAGATIALVTIALGTLLVALLALRCAMVSGRRHV
jgi:hypothetical protein